MAPSPRSPYTDLLARVTNWPMRAEGPGHQEGDRVVIYMPMSIEGVVAMHELRASRRHSVVFGGFSAQSLRDRIQDAGAVLLITADEQMRGGKACRSRHR